MRSSLWDLCLLAVMRCHEISLWGFMILGRYVISFWHCLAFFWIVSCLMMRVDVFFLPLWDFMLRFPSFCCALYSNIRVSKVTIIECELRTTSWEETWTRSGFSSWFSLVARWGCKAWVRVSSGEGGDDGICWEGEWWFLAVMRFPDEISCFFVALVSFGLVAWCM